MCYQRIFVSFLLVLFLGRSGERQHVKEVTSEELETPTMKLYRILSQARILVDENKRLNAKPLSMKCRYTSDPLCQTPNIMQTRWLTTVSGLNSLSATTTHNPVDPPPAMDGRWKGPECQPGERSTQ